MCDDSELVYKPADEMAESLLRCLKGYSATNLVQGSTRDCLIDGNFDLTTVAKELLAEMYVQRK
jgi:hypothetical protein